VILKEFPIDLEKIYPAIPKLPPRKKKK